ncbi:MAG: hypothetical protein V4549_18130 [Bacteroidota bacterium]
MTLIEIISDVVSKINTGTFSFHYAEEGEMNLWAENAEFPIASLFFIPSLKFDLVAGGRIGEEYPVSLFIGDKDKLDSTALESEPLIEIARLACRNILSQLQNYKDLSGNKLIDSISVTRALRGRVVNKFDVAASGIFLDLLIKPTIVTGVCV